MILVASLHVGRRGRVMSHDSSLRISARFMFSDPSSVPRKLRQLPECDSDAVVDSYRRTYIYTAQAAPAGQEIR